MEEFKDYEKDLDQNVTVPFEKRDTLIKVTDSIRLILVKIKTF